MINLCLGRHGVTVHAEEEAEEFTSFGQPTRLITCANHGNNVICS